jgi:hypothetical protein
MFKYQLKNIHVLSVWHVSNRISSSENIMLKSCVICTTSLDNYDGQLFIPSSFSTKTNKMIDEMKESKNIMWI